MSYDKIWFDEYKKYLNEPMVRYQHNRMLKLFNSLIRDDMPKNVIDLGCGTCEYYQYGKFDDYVGTDINPIGHEGAKTMIGDFKKEYIGHILDEARINHEITPTIFVSLFATEVHCPVNEKYGIYDDLFFDEMSNIIAGCVSGVFSKNKKGQERTIKSDGSVIYQSVENQANWWSPYYTEIRTCIEVPSEMFGDEIEVWKFFIRNSLPNVSQF